MPTQRDISTRRFAARVILLLSVFYTSCSGEELTAWDYIMKANMGKEKLMNVHKFDIRLPRFRSGAGEGELDAAARDETRLWTGGVVPYVVLRSLRDRPMYKTNLQKAMKEWMTYTCIKFRPRKPTDRDYVVFGYGVGCNADVGRRGNRQYVSLGKGCSDTSVIIHEIGHVVGFWHEQNRPDRNKYVDILWENIIAEYKFAFDEYTEYRIDSRNVTYDYQSIMHYGNYAFSSNKRPTIVAKNSKVKSFGNRHLSPLDIKQANLVYKCPAKDSMYPKFPEDFLFSAKGTLTDKRCILINEPRKRSQNLTWLCHKKTERNADIHWSHNGKISNMDCTHISSPFGKDRKGLWNDNYLCVANDSVYKFHWSKSVPIAGLGCLRWPERTRKDRYRAFLCAKFTSGPIDGGWSSWSSWTKCSRGCGGGYQERRRYCTNPEPKNYGKPCYGRDYWRRYCNKQRCAEYPVWPTDFEFSYFPYTPYEKNCIRVYEREAELYWRNFYFCSVGHKRRINMRWSDMGRQSNMRCTKIYEPEDRQGWDNNYLCVPRSSKYRFEWSHSGPKRGLQCIKWFVKNGTNGWDDNYLCSRGLSYKNVITTSALTASFAVDGGWSKWSNWSHCSKTCGQGYQERIRSCTQPSPSSGGKNCSGRPLEKKSCKITDCPMACNGEFRGNRGKLISPKFPYYPQNSKCHWTITVPEGKRIEMRFTYMRLKASHSKCSSDNLVVRDGHNTRSGVLEKFCRNYKSPQTIQSTGNNMYLQLQTTNALRRGGFKAEWSAKDIPKSKKTNCGAKLTALSGTITSPFYPKKYPHNKECTWLITVPIDRLLTIKFDTFHMESHKSCAYDKLEVFDGITEKAPKRTFCGRKRPDNITAFMNTLLIKFRSDSTRHYRGFKISWSTKKRTFP